MEIIKCTNTRNTSTRTQVIEYLVIHYTAGATSRKGSARNTASYFGTTASASADYIVDDVEAVQYNPDPKHRYTWAVGKNYSNSGSKFYGRVNNQNSVSIEVCSTNKQGKYTNNFDDYYFTDEVVQTAITLAKQLMKEYNIDINHVCTHFEARGKTCPAVSGWGARGGSYVWDKFKKQLSPTIEVNKMTKNDVKEFVDLCTDEQAYQLLKKAMAYTDSKVTPDWAKESWGKATDAGVVNGKAAESFIKRDEIIIVLDRLGLIKE